MSVQKPPEHEQRPDGAKNMDDTTRDEHSSTSNTDNKLNARERVPLDPPTNTPSSIQEDIISASTNHSDDKNVVDSENANAGSVNSGLNVPSQEEIEAVIVKGKSGEVSEPEPKEKKSRFSFSSEAGKKSASETFSTPPPIPPKPGRVASEPERPVRGYGALTFFPLLTLTILLIIHVASFIYSSSDQLLLENPQQISVAKSINLSSDIFIPTLEGEIVKDISPGQFWFLGGLFKLSPFPEEVSLNIAGAVAALLMLWAVYLLCKAVIPKNKGVAFSAGLVILSSVLYLGSAWFFRTEMLGVALITLSQAMLFKGLKRPSGAYLWFIPAMILTALAILTQGLIMAVPLLIPLAFYLLISGNLRRLFSPDLLSGLVALIVVLGAWLGGAWFFLDSVKVSSYLFPVNLVFCGLPISFTLNQAIIFGGVLLLPWLFLIILLIDRILVKIPSIPSSLKTENGQGMLFVITVLLAAVAVVSIDRLANPALSLIMLPPMAILAAKAVLYMSRPRARIFIIFTAILFAALTALFSLKAGGFGNAILPWDISLWASLPLIGATAFCTVFLAKAAQVSAGKVQLLVYAICWLLIAQVFLFGGMPASAKYLKFSDLQAAIEEKIAQAPRTVAYLNTPAWASEYNIAKSQFVNSWQQVEELAKLNPVLVVLPESDWNALGKKQYPFKKIESQILLLTPYVLAESDYPLTQTTLTPEATLKEQPATEATIAAQNATVFVVAEQAETGIDAQNATVPVTSPKVNEQLESEEVVVVTENATQPIDTPIQEKANMPQGQNATVPAEESAVPLNVPEALAKTDSSVDAQTPPEPVAPQKETLPILTHEEIISTTYTPKAMRELDLIYGVMPGLPELSIIVRYREIKQLE